MDGGEQGHRQLKIGELSLGLIRVALIFLGLAVVTFMLLLVVANWEQARSPGEDSLGVAVLGMIFMPFILLFLIAGAACLITGLLLVIFAQARR